MTAPGATILGVAGPHLPRDEAAFLRDADPWGFILFARNVETPAQLARLTADLRAAVGREAPVFVDQEGGRVARLRPPAWRDWLPPLDQVTRTGPRAAARGLWLRYRIIAQELRAVGIDGNCAPLADIAAAATHPFLRNRCYGGDPATVAERGRAVAEACLAGGVLPVLKHIPGHGRATADSHEALPVAGASLADLTAWDFAPFAALADLPLAMTAHMLYPALDPQRPATLSAAVIGHIRRSIGFRGLLMTDDISMRALSGPPGALAAAAIRAGCDVVLHCNGDRTEMAAVAAAAGRLSPAAASRADQALARRRAPGPIDIAGAEAELSGLLSAGSNG